jgi:SAM-dependent methyltransferase
MMFEPGEFGNYGHSTFAQSEYKVKQRTDMEALLSPNFAPTNIVELGCADGTNLLYFGDIFNIPCSELVGVDIVGARTENYRRFSFRHLSAEAWLESCEQKFDLIIVSDVLEHLYNPWRVLKGLRHRLSAHGRMLISVPNCQNISYLRAMFSGHFFYQSTGLFDQTHIRFFSALTLGHYLSRAGFVVERTGYRPDLTFASLRRDLDARLQVEPSVLLSLGGFSLRVDLSNIDALLGQQVIICAGK